MLQTPLPLPVYPPSIPPFQFRPFSPGYLNAEILPEGTPANAKSIHYRERKGNIKSKLKVVPFTSSPVVLETFED